MHRILHLHRGPTPTPAAWAPATGIGMEYETREISIETWPRLRQRERGKTVELGTVLDSLERESSTGRARLEEGQGAAAAGSPRAAAGACTHVVGRKIVISALQPHPGVVQTAHPEAPCPKHLPVLRALVRQGAGQRPAEPGPAGERSRATGRFTASRIGTVCHAKRNRLDVDARHLYRRAREGRFSP